MGRSGTGNTAGTVSNGMSPNGPGILYPGWLGSGLSHEPVCLQTELGFGDGGMERSGLGSPKGNRPVRLRSSPCEAARDCGPCRRWAPDWSSLTRTGCTVCLSSSSVLTSLVSPRESTPGVETRAETLTLHLLNSSCPPPHPCQSDPSALASPSLYTSTPINHLIPLQ